MTHQPGPYPAAADAEELALRARLLKALHHRPPEPPPGTVTISVPNAPDAQPAWYQGPQPTEQAATPGVHVTVVPETPKVHPWRAHIRAWLLYNGTAAAAGWAVGFTGAIDPYLASAHDAGLPAGIGLLLVSALPGVWLPYFRAVPPPLRPAVAWICRIPPATILLALTLYTPQTMIGAAS